MSLDTRDVLLDQLLHQYALFAIGMLVVFAAGLFLWKKLRKIEVQLDNLREEVNHLNLIEARRFLAGLNSSKARQETRARQRARAGPSSPAAPPAPAHPGSSGATGDDKFADAIERALDSIGEVIAALAWERADSSNSSIVPELADSEGAPARAPPEAQGVGGPAVAASPNPNGIHGSVMQLTEADTGRRPGEAQKAEHVAHSSSPFSSVHPQLGVTG